MNNKVAAIAFLAIFGVVLLQYFQISGLKDEIWARNANYKELESDFMELEAELNRTRLEFEPLQTSLDASETSLRGAEVAIRELNYSKSIRAHILGVKGDEGVAIPLEIEIKKGTGRVLIDIGDIFLEDDVQSTAKTAFALADVKSKGDLAEKDATIRIINPYKKSLSISGMSSGAIMTMGLVALGKNATLKEGVTITGTIKGDGSIGRVLYISQKAEAAKALNATVMLVPGGQWMPVSGIELIEISDIEEAMEYLLE
jgi:predicted S18 family serine protease